MTTYYMRADGTAANKAAATGPGTDQSACMNIAVHNGETFSAGDVIYLCDDGGIYRGLIVVPSAGSEGNHILYEPEPGDSPAIYGSEQQSTWLDQGDNVWRCSQASMPNAVFFVKDGTSYWGTKQASTEALAAEFDWYQDGSDYLYCYSTTDPDAAYDRVEATFTAGNLITCAKDYVTLQGNIEVAFSYGNAVHWSRVSPAHNIVGALIDGIVVHHCGEQIAQGERGIIFYHVSNGTISNCTVYAASGVGIATWSLAAGLDSDNVLVEGNTIYDCGHSQTSHLYLNGTGGESYNGLTIRRNHVYCSDGFQKLADDCDGIYVRGDNELVASLSIEYNLIHDIPQGALSVAGYTTGAVVANNTVARTYSGSTATGSRIAIAVTANNVAAVVRNNLAVDTIDRCFDVTDSSVIAGCDNNLWYNSAGTYYTKVDGSLYASGDFASYKTDTGFDANGLWEDPLFLGPGNNDFHLRSDSPCIEAGTPTGGLTLDFDGHPLNRGINPDIGCSETLKGGPRGL